MFMLFIIFVLLILGLVALRWGADSRETLESPEWERRNQYWYCL